jgi:hypothetical protein
MKIKKFKVDVYDWDVTLIETKSAKDWRKVKKELVKFDISPEDIEYAKTSMHCQNGGEHFFQKEQRASLVILYPMTTPLMRMEVLCHEKRHVEDRILQRCLVEDIEASAYLAGYLGKMMI